VLSEQPLGVLVNAYATNISPITLSNVLAAAMQGHAGHTQAGELVLVEATAGRCLPEALYARWSPAES
jgi:23S rRNA (cytosine1962-C5)-methyltransferase